MPELPEVEAIRRSIVRRILQVPIKSVDVHLDRIIRAGDVTSLCGRRFTSIERRGKYLVMTLDDSRNLFVHFRMSGTLIWQKESEPLPAHARSVFNFDGGRWVYVALRTLGGFHLLGYGETPWKELGIDAIDKGLTVEYLEGRLNRIKSSIKVALLNQSILAGVGNIYASESLFRARIMPDRPANSLDHPELERLIRHLQELLSEAIESSGTTFRDFKLSDGREGEFKRFLNVYGREGEPCRRCGETIQRIVQAQRSTFFCPGCQRLPDSAAKSS